MPKDSPMEIDIVLDKKDGDKPKRQAPPEFDKWKRSKNDFDAKPDMPMEKPAAAPKEMKRGFMSDAHSGHGRHKRPRGGG